MSDKLKPIPVSISSVEVTYLVLPPDANGLATLFGGKLMSWIDLAASIVSSRHSRQVCVTASMDQLDFLQPIHVGDIVILKSAVNFTGRTSMEVGVRVEAENPLTGQRTYAATSYLTFVAVDKAGHPVAIPPILPETEIEKKRFQAGKERRAHRIEQAKKKKI
jgi:acyl-CoA hydrolase